MKPSTWRRELDRGARKPVYWRNEYQRGRGETLEVRYRIYCDAMKSLGQPAKDFNDWLNS